VEYIGIDAHLEYSLICAIDDNGAIVRETRIPTTKAAFQREFDRGESTRICIEASSVSPWIETMLTAFGHDVVVANPSRLRLIAESKNKNDRLDAETLARLVRSDVALIKPAKHRSQETLRKRALIRARTVLVRNRTAAINAVRGILRSQGVRLPYSATEDFASRFEKWEVHEELREFLEPLVRSIATTSEQIAVLEEKIHKLANIPEIKRLQRVPGVGPNTALAFALGVEDPSRFRRSRDVAAYFGLLPAVRSSGGHTKTGRITKQGDPEVRFLLVQAAYVLMRSKESSRLKTWALALKERIGNKKAAVAVARKLAVVLHRLMASEQAFHPFHDPARATEPAA
jgi:transposase